MEYMENKKESYRSIIAQEHVRRNNLFAEQNKIGQEMNELALFSGAEDELSKRYIEIKRKLALANLLKQAEEAGIEI